MNNKDTINKIVLTLFLVLTVNSCAGQQKIDSMKENEVYQVWEYLLEIDGESTEVFFSTQFISPLPQSVKSIIAYYSTRIPPYASITSDNAVAQSFGDYPTLQQAQTALLKDWKYTNDLPKVEKNGNQQHIATLYAMKSEKRVFFWYYEVYDRKADADEFIISKDGKITHIKHYNDIKVNK